MFDTIAVCPHLSIVNSREVTVRELSRPKAVKFVIAYGTERGAMPWINTRPQCRWTNDSCDRMLDSFSFG
ncbi:MAG: hypothetical protein NVSMB22_20800 [Chloroflexota bacterium]